MKATVLSIVLLGTLLGCPAPVDVNTGNGIEEEEEEETGETEEEEEAGETEEENADCPGEFPSGQGPGCCSDRNERLPDRDRAVCTDSEWTCEVGSLCTCNDEVADYECLDSCDWTQTQAPGCIFGHHYECFEPTTVPANSCE